MGAEMTESARGAALSISGGRSTTLRPPSSPVGTWRSLGWELKRLDQGTGSVRNHEYVFRSLCPSQAGGPLPSDGAQGLGADQASGGDLPGP